MLILLLHAARLSAQADAKLCVITLDTRNMAIDRQNTWFVIGNFHSGNYNDAPKELARVRAEKPVMIIRVPADRPCTVNGYLYRNDSMISMTSVFVIAEEHIKVVFTKGRGEVLNSPETDFLTDNLFLFLSVPAPLYITKGFSSDLCKRSYKLSIPENMMLELRWKEYEKKIVKEVTRHRDMYQTLEALYHNRDDISTFTLDSCRRLLGKYKNCFLTKKLASYIENSKFLYDAQTLPSLMVSDSTGRNTMLERTYAGFRYTLVDFWASWCAPCRVKMKALKKQYPAIDTAQLQVISVSIDEDKHQWLNAVSKDSIAWKNFYDPLGWKGQAVTTLNITGIPYNIIVDDKGRIVAKNMWDDELLNFLVKNKLIR